MIYITRFLIKKPLLSNLLLVFILVLSVVSFFSIKRQGMPRVDFQQMRITTIYPGASPEDVELNVTIKLEDALKTVSGIEKYTSRSMENTSIIQVFIDPDAEKIPEIKDEIRRAIEGVSDLPEDVKDKPFIFDVKNDNFEIYEVVLTLPGKSELTLRKHALELKRRLKDVKEVSWITGSGVLDREIKIKLDLGMMKYHQISFDEVIQSIRNNKLRISGGSIESFTSKKNIVTISEFENAKDIGNIIIRSNFLGNKVQIKDVAAIIDGLEDEDTLVRFNGNKGMAFWIAKKGSADVIATVDKIKKTVARYKKSSGEKDLHIFSTFDMSIETKNRLSIVTSNAIAGFILVIIILFIFLDRRTAMWTAIGIPVSIGITIILLPFFDVSINSISLCGMVVVLGMVVDDAIIIAESITRSREGGLSSKEAAIKGLSLVLKPVLGTIITTMIAFVPIYFIPGMIGKFAVEIPTIVILMLAASFIEATTILPAHLAHEKEGTAKIKEPPGQKIFNYLENKYKVVMQWTLHHRYITLGIFMLFLLSGTGISFLITNFNMFPIDQAYRMFIYGETDKDSTLDFNAQETKKIEKIIQDMMKKNKGVVHSYKTHVGMDFNNGMGWIRSTNHFIVQMTLTPATKRDLTLVQVKDYIVTEFKRLKKPGIRKLNYYLDGGGPPVGKPIEIKIWGNNNKKRKVIVSAVMKDLKKFGLQDVDSDLREGKSELRILPNYERIAAANLNVSSIASTIRTAFDGTVVTHMQTADEKIPFRVVLNEKSKDYDKPFKNLLVRNNTGHLVNISTMVKVNSAKSPQNIFHYNSYRTNTITANVDLKKTTPNAIYNKLKDFYKNFEKKNPGFRIRLGGEAEESSKTIFKLIMATLAALIAIYFLLVVQFNSFMQPFMVIMSVPFGVVGILLAFGIHGMDLSMLALVGVLGFAGVAVNDSLVMVDCINRISKEESSSDTESFIDAIINGASQRLRPILLTTVSTMAGLIPTAYGLIGGIDSFISPMVMAMTWGLFLGTLSILVVIPVLYMVTNDVQSKIVIILNKFNRRSEGFDIK